MKVVITGGGGFLGNRLARALLEREILTLDGGAPSRIDELVLFDRLIGPEARAGLDARARCIEGDIADREQVAALADRDDLSVFHLASVLSGEGERDFDLALRVNLDGARHVLEACRARASRPKLLFTSSVAAFGGEDMPATVSDSTKRLPQTTYGMTKVIGELLLDDYSRKGYLDGRGARLPTVVIRPGRPNSAASSFASGLFREPLHGEPCELPVARSQEVPVIGYRTVIRSLIALHEVPAESLGADRTYTLPAIRHTVAEMIAALERVAAGRGLPLGPVLDRPDPVIQRIVSSWPTGTEASRALALGLPPAAPLEEVISDYLEDFGPPPGRS